MCTHYSTVRRHYVNALVHRATGVQGATALVARHAFRQTRCQRARWVHCLADFAHALTDPRSWPRIRAAGQVCHNVIRSPQTSCVPQTSIQSMACKQERHET